MDDQLTPNKMHQARLKALDNQFIHWKTLYEDINDFILPRRGIFPDRGKPYDAANVKRSNLIINDAGTRANRILGAGMQGGLCSPSRPWFRYTLLDDDRAKFGPVKEWLNICERVVYKVYAKSNFYTEAHVNFEEQGGFGTSFLLQEKHSERVVNFVRFSPGEYRLACGPDGQIDTAYRYLWLTAKQMQRMFGEARLSEQVKTALKANPYEYFEVVYCVFPRTNRDVSKLDNANMSYESRWFEKGADKKTLRVSGFKGKPFCAPRWSVVGQSPYGLGPGHDCLGNIKMLQQMERGGIKGLHQEIQPALNVPSQFKNVVSLLPGAHNYTDTPEAKVTPILDVKLDQQKLEGKISAIEGKIERTYFTDLFLLITSSERSGREMTATEILKRQEEKLLMLGPTIEREIFEFLDPTNLRTFVICMEEGLFPDPPDDVIGQDLEIKYVSVLAQAQKLADAQSMHAYMGEVERVALLEPDIAIAKTDFEEYLEHFGDTVGVPAKIIRSKEETEVKMAEIQQARKQAEEAEQMREAAGTMKDLGQANLDSKTALGALKEEMGA